MADPIDWATPAAFATMRGPQDNISNGTSAAERGRVCELRSFETHFNSKNEKVTLQAGTKKRVDDPKDSQFDSALLLTKTYNADKTLKSTELVVRSPHMKKALQNVISEYPGVTFDSSDIIIEGTPRCLFHYRQQLYEYGAGLTDPIAQEHMIFMLKYLNKALEGEIKDYYTFMENPGVTPGIHHKNLWMAFRPGDLVYHRSGTCDAIYRLKSMRQWSEKGWWRLETDRIVYSGDEWGFRDETIFVHHYEGYRPLRELSCCPLQHLPSKDKVVERLKERGRKYLTLCKVQHLSYQGTAWLPCSNTMTEADDPEDHDAFGYLRRHVCGRVIVDHAKYYTLRPGFQPDFAIGQQIKMDSDVRPTLSDEQLLLCHHRVPGFDLTSKDWCFFEVDDLDPVAYNLDAFEKLLLADSSKRIIKALVQAQADELLAFDDLIKGKGTGIVILLYGAPGVGKTLTAESVADYLKCPLYQISSMDLGEHPSSVEDNLTSALKLSAHWKAVALIDEADIFLERRSVKDLQRNGLVSAFLRVLEYHEGIIILTTNRISVLDSAVRSRIHLAVKYPSLDLSSRRQLWRIFITAEFTAEAPSWMDDNALSLLAKEELNGRQIKNVVRIAKALAAVEGKELDLEDINMTLRAVYDFERESLLVNDASTLSSPEPEIRNSELVPRKRQRTR